MRCWLPIVLGFVALIVAGFFGPVVTWVLIMVAFGLILDGLTKLWERAGGTGNLTTFKL
jgi:hypothetical protein